MQRPKDFLLDPLHPMASRIKFAMLGANPGHEQATDSSIEPKHGKLVGYTTVGSEPKDAWKIDGDIGRWRIATPGASRYVTCGDLDAFTPVGDFAVGCWFYCVATSGNNPLVNKAGLAGTREWQITNDFDNGLGFLVGDSSGAWNVLHRVTAAPAGAWRHFMGVKRGNAVSSYLDGVLTKSPTTYTGTSVANTTSIMTIGRSAGLTDTYANALIADVVFMSPAPSDSEITILASRFDPMLGGLLRVPGRSLWRWAPIGGGTPAAYKHWLSRRKAAIIGGGTI